MIPIPALDNPAWSALTTEQSAFALGGPMAKRYQPGILPFAAVENPDPEAAAGLDALLQPGESFYIIGDPPPLPAGWQVEHELRCAQLLGPQFLQCLPQPKETITPLGENEKTDMFRLIDGIQPGYYLPDTWRLVTTIGSKVKSRTTSLRHSL